MWGLKKRKVVEAIPVYWIEEGVIRMKVTNVIQTDYDKLIDALKSLGDREPEGKVTNLDLIELLKLWRKLGESVGNKCLAEGLLQEFCRDLLDVIEKITPFISFEKANGS